MPQIHLTVPTKLEHWFRTSAPPGVSRSEHLRQLIRERGEHPDRAVFPNECTTDDMRPMTVKLDDETYRIMVAAAAQMGMSHTAYCRWLMRHAGLSVCVGLDPVTMQKLREISGGDVESFVRDLIDKAVEHP